MHQGVCREWVMVQHIEPLRSTHEYGPQRQKLTPSVIVQTIADLNITCTPRYRISSEFGQCSARCGLYLAVYAGHREVRDIFRIDTSIDATAKCGFYREV